MPILARIRDNILKMIAVTTLLGNIVGAHEEKGKPVNIRINHN